MRIRRLVKPYRTFPAGQVIEEGHESTAIFNATQRLANETRLLAIGTVVMSVTMVVQTIWG